MNGVVVKSTGSWYQVRSAAGDQIACRIKGKLRLEKIKHTNPITVGDHVTFEMEAGLHTGIIASLEPRKNYIIRKASNLSKQTHILASNIDLALLVATIAFPPTSTGFIDRFLATAEAYHIPAAILFNKHDLITADSAALEDELIDLYTHIGYPCIRVSSRSGAGIPDLRKLIAGKVSLFMGHSGVGKSTLLNTLDPALELTTREISNYHLKGQHTTTFAEMHRIASGDDIIDTPGIREFGVVELEGAEISHYFVEMRPYLTQCKFNNCSHVSEPGCAVRAAVESGEISGSRFHSYLSILANEDLHK